MVLIEQIRGCRFAARSSHADIDDIQEATGRLEVPVELKDEQVLQVTGGRGHAELGPVSVVQGQRSDEHVTDFVVDRAVRVLELDNSQDEFRLVHKCGRRFLD
jgi:hypothetical protein